jgi:16S rRNA (guanine527-N7)-methyltransferase
MKYQGQTMGGTEERLAELNAVTGRAVSRETYHRLRLFMDLLGTWNRRINLVGANEINRLWRRHVLDSAQLLAFLDKTPGSWLDLGSGAGFPALVVAALLSETSAPEMHLVESNGKKCAFLRHAVRELDLSATIHNCRIDSLPEQVSGPDVISARALASLPELLNHVESHIGPNTHCFFHKGQDVEFELTQSAKYWSMQVRNETSRVEKGGHILILSNIHRISVPAAGKPR